MSKLSDIREDDVREIAAEILAADPGLCLCVTDYGFSVAIAYPNGPSAIIIQQAPRPEYGRKLIKLDKAAVPEAIAQLKARFCPPATTTT